VLTDMDSVHVRPGRAMVRATADASSSQPDPSAALGMTTKRRVFRPWCACQSVEDNAVRRRYERATEGLADVMSVHSLIDDLRDQSLWRPLLVIPSGVEESACGRKASGCSVYGQGRCARGYGYRPC